MAKTKITKAKRNEVINFLTGINAEGGAAEYFTNYSSPDSLTEYGFIPPGFITAAKAMSEAHEKLQEEISKLHEMYGIEDTETEY